MDGGRTQLFESLVHLTLALAGQTPLILFVDDLQWADSATLDWLLYAVRRWRDSEARILLLVSLRSEALQPPGQPQLPNLIEWLAQIGRELEPFHLERVRLFYVPSYQPPAKPVAYHGNRSKRLVINRLL